MKRNNKVVCGLFMAGMISMSATITGFAGSSTNTTKDAGSTTAAGRTGTAGIIVEISNAGSEAMSEAGILTASVDATSNVVVAEGQETETEEAAEEKTTEAAQTVMAAEAETETETKEIINVVAGAASLEGTKVAELTEAVTEAATENTEAATEENTEAATEEAAEENTEAATEEAAEENTEAATEEVEENTEAATEEAAEENTEAATEEVAEENTEAAVEEETEETAQSPVETEWANRVMANVEESMNIRAAAGEDAELAGKFYRGDVAEVISNDGTWTQITSGNVTGFVKNEFCVYGMDAYNLANAVCTTYATSMTGGLNVRAAAGEDAEVLTQAAEGDKLTVDTAAAPVEGWVAVAAEGQTAYVSAQYVSVAQNLGTALNMEEVAAKEAALAAEKAAKEAEELKKKNAVSASSDEVTLLGALIQTEAGGSSYEGMVAVGAVVMNRVRSGAYPGSISGVIYQGGQFTPAGNGSVDSLVRNGGVRKACLQAAQEALNGTDNTNGCKSFRSASSGHAGTVIGANVFF